MENIARIRGNISKIQYDPAYNGRFGVTPHLKVSICENIQNEAGETVSTKYYLGQAYGTKAAESYAKLQALTNQVGTWVEATGRYQAAAQPTFVGTDGKEHQSSDFLNGLELRILKEGKPKE